MEANFQQKVTIIRDSYCFQLQEFSNDNSFGTKIYFEFSSETSQCSINDLEHLSAILFFVCFTKKLVSVYTTGLYKTHLYYFKGSFYCLLHVESIAALTPLFFGGFLAHVC